VKYVAALTPASVPPVTEADVPEPGFSADVDALLNTTERARRTAWIAHIESALGDLVVRCRRLPKLHIVVIHHFFTGPCVLLRSCKLRRRHASHPIFFL
jgi:hypothetical protein